MGAWRERSDLRRLRARENTDATHWAADIYRRTGRPVSLLTRSRSGSTERKPAGVDAAHLRDGNWPASVTITNWNGSTT